LGVALARSTSFEAILLKFFGFSSKPYHHHHFHMKIAF
jgi:hypothetical protein